ncbi:MAG: DUF1573 domain-containing protein [Bacteroidetes bacterium]|nr:DUF1573 domain-containing protein [Bacteroidota bacterium]
MRYPLLASFLCALLLAAGCKEAESYKGTDTSADETAKQPITTVRFDQTLHDFGEIPEGQIATHRFEFTNTGKYPLQIGRVQPTCGCTTPDWSKKPIPPGKKGYVEVKFDSNGRPGAATKTVRVVANTDPQETVLTFKASVTGKP